MVGDAGHTVTSATGGQEGIDTMRAELDQGRAFAAMITDLGMPYVDGRRVASAAKQASPSTAVILLTGWGHRLMSDRDRPPQVDRVLGKPPKLREVREALIDCCSPRS
jgi:CheY-like chemotaxis protein